MRTQTLRTVLLSASLLAPAALWSQQGTEPVTLKTVIQVIDQSGAAIPTAQVRLTPPPDPLPAKLETDENGRLSINLQPGDHALVVSQRGFKSWSQNIFIAKPVGDPSASQLFQVVLQIGSYSGPTISYPKDSLVLNSGFYHAPVVLSPAQFRALPHTTVMVHNSHTNADETYSGVPLATLLTMVNAPIGKDFHHEALTSYLIANGADGYSVLLSLAEADPSFHTGQVLVADARDTHPLEKSGPYELIVSEDKRPARWVRNLESVTLLGPR